MKGYLTLVQVLELMKKRQNGRTAKDFASELGITPQYLCDIYQGRREPGRTVIQAMGLTKHELYTRGI